MKINILILIGILLSTSMVSSAKIYINGSNSGDEFNMEIPDTEAQYSYIIYKPWYSVITGTINAKNGSTGKIDFSGTNICQVASDTVNVTTSGLILLKKGTYIGTNTSLSIFDCVILHSNIDFRGEGENSTIIKIGNSVYYNGIAAVNATNIHISDIQIDGNKDNNIEHGVAADRFQNGIYFYNVMNSTVEGVYSHDSIYHGIFNYASSYNIFQNNILSHNGYRGIHAHAGSSYNTYQFNKLYQNGEGVGNSGDGGLFVVFDGETNYNNIIGNIIKDDKYSGIQIAGNGANNNIIGNLINNPRSTAYGIYITNGDTLGSTIIDSNTIKSYHHGISLANGAPSNIIISNNQITTFSANGIYFPFGGSNIQIRNNNINASWGYGISLISTRNGIVSGNIINSPIEFYDSIRLSAVTNTSIFNNWVQANSAYGINEINSNTNIIRDNYLVVMKGSNKYNLTSPATDNFPVAPIDFGNSAIMPPTFITSGKGNRYHNTSSDIECFSNASASVNYYTNAAGC